MEKKEKKTAIAATKSSAKVLQGEKPKSKIALFWERNPNGIGTIVNMEAVLR